MEYEKNEPKNLSSHFPKSKKEENEFGKGKEDILTCNECKAFYYNKSWHHFLNVEDRDLDRERIKFTTCPACNMINDHMFEGELTVENIKEELMDNLIRTIENVGEEGYDNDCQDRIIEIEESEDSLRITTTENQLAVRIGKKIKESFNGEIDIKYSKDEDLARVKVVLK